MEGAHETRFIVVPVDESTTAPIPIMSMTPPDGPTRSRPRWVPPERRARPSYRHRWHDLDFATFCTVGVIARRAPDGTPRFNFPQTVWWFPDVTMDWSRRADRRTRTLALNILTPLLPERDVQAHFGLTSRRAVLAAAPFAAAFLQEMPADGGCIPCEVLKQWIEEELQRASG
jgi:hypothetical protein